MYKAITYLLTMIFIDYLYYKIYTIYTTKLGGYIDPDIQSISLLSALFGLNLLVISEVLFKILAVDWGNQYLFQGIKVRALSLLIILILAIIFNSYRYLSIRKIPDLIEHFEKSPRTKKLNTGSRIYVHATIISFIFIFIFKIT